MKGSEKSAFLPAFAPRYLQLLAGFIDSFHGTQNQRNWCSILAKRNSLEFECLGLRDILNSLNNYFLRNCWDSQTSCCLKVFNLYTLIRNRRHTSTRYTPFFKITFLLTIRIFHHLEVKMPSWAPQSSTVSFSLQKLILSIQICRFDPFLGDQLSRSHVCWCLCLVDFPSHLGGSSNLSTETIVGKDCWGNYVEIYSNLGEMVYLGPII